MASSSRIFSSFVSDKVGGHSEQPCSLVGDSLLPERADERLLRDLLCPVSVAEPPRQIPDQRGVVCPEKTLDVRQLAPTIATEFPEELTRSATACLYRSARS